MRTVSLGLFGLAVLLLASSVAQAQGVDLQPGQKVAAAFGDRDDVHHFRFYALEGDTISISFTIPTKSELEPVVALLGPGTQYQVPDFVDGKMTLDLVVTDHGRHQLLVYAAGTHGDYSFKFKQKHPKVLEIRRRSGELAFFLTAGSKATIQVKPYEKDEDCRPRLDGIEDPAGTDILGSSKYKESKKKAKAKIARAPADGEYRLQLAECEGNPYLLITIKIKAAKRWTAKLNEKTAFESMVVGLRFSNDQGGSDYFLHAEANGPAVASALVRFPEGSGIDDVPLTGGDGGFRLDHAAAPPSGIYQLVVTTQKGKEVVKPFLIRGGWPADVVVSVADHATSTPEISWTGGGGAEFWYLEIQEWDGDAQAWYTKFFTVVPGTELSYTPPEGPLDDRPHAVHIIGVHRSLKGAYGGWIPD